MAWQERRMKQKECLVCACVRVWCGRWCGRNACSVTCREPQTARTPYHAVR